MNKNIIIVLVLILLAGAGYYLYSQSKKMATVPVATTAPIAESSPSAEGTGSSVVMEGVKEFSVSGSAFKFDLKEIKVNKGDKVRLVFTNTQGSHNFVVDEFNLKTKVLQAGQTETVEFIAHQAGTFEYYCSVGNHRQQGMVGKLIVQ